MLDVQTETEWFAICREFEERAQNLIRGCAPRERVRLIDDLEDTAKRIHSDLMERETRLLAAQGFGTSRIAYALGVSPDRIRRLSQVKQIEMPNSQSLTPDGAVDLREDFVALRDRIDAMPEGYRPVPSQL